MAKRCCADDANLCELVEINTGENEQVYKGVNDILRASKFDVQYRKQLERMSACGTVGGYVRLDNAKLMSDGTLKNGKIALNYCYGNNIIPLTVINDEVIECAFCSENTVKGKAQGVLVIFTMGETGNYTSRTVYFNEGLCQSDKTIDLQLGEVKPFFIMRTAEVNNLEDMEGYGYPKLYTSIPVLEVLDLTYNILYGDLEKGEKLVFLNELLACITRDAQGRPQLTPAQKSLFVLLGEKLPENDSIIKEYNPVIRIDDITKAFETALSLLSMSFGYGTKKYTFEDGQIKSATEYIGEKQDALQELNKQRKEAESYIRDVVNAIVWFSNKFNGTNWIVDDLSIDFDDSFIENKSVKRENMRADALSFPEIPQLKVWYLMEAYNLDEEEAQKLVNEAQVF